VSPQPKNPVDTHVGLRIRTARLAAGQSQGRLADHLGVTFQQVQKYEKGKNRVGVGRLTDIARFLSVPTSYFFENVPSSNWSARTNEGIAALTEALSTEEGIRIARALARIPEPDLRRRIADLMEVIAERESRPKVA
jgi:transcriptional regulator with XRE-family HTH domain